MNTDQLAGYEIGRKQGRQRIGGKLFDRHPPDHLTGQRAADWRQGYADGLADRRINKKQTVSIVEYRIDGAEHTARMNGTLEAIVNRVESLGAAGDVIITTPAGVAHRCGI